MVNDHSDSERGNPLPPHRLLFPMSSSESLAGTRNKKCWRNSTRSRKQREQFFSTMLEESKGTSCEVRDNVNALRQSLEQLKVTNTKLDLQSRSMETMYYSSTSGKLKGGYSECLC